MEPRSRCNNAIHVLNYFKKLGVKESAILNGLSVDKAYISKPHNWITVKDWYKMIANCQKEAPLTTLEDWYNIGFYLKDNEESKLFEMITKLVGVKNMYRFVPRYTNSFNTYMKISVNAIGPDHADYIIRTEESVIACGIGLMVRYTAGICSIIPHVICQEPARVEILYDQARLKNILEQLYPFFDLKYSEKNGYVLINGQKMARRIQLLKSSGNDDIYSSRYSFDPPWNATVILEDLIVDEKILLNKDHIFDAPYGRVRFSWEKKPRRFELFKSSKLRNEILLHLNEQIFLAEKRHFESERLRAKEKQYIVQLRSTIKELATLEERERRSMAEDLHDTVAQTLGLGISKLKNIMNENAWQGDVQLAELQKTFEQALEEARSLTVQICPPTLHLVGIEGALQDLSSDIAGKYGIRVDFNSEIQEPFRLDGTLQTILYRSIRELFMNMMKHSQSKQVFLSMSLADGDLIVHFEDKGIGFDISILNERTSSNFGLFSIMERIRILNGQVKIDSYPGGGTKIKIHVPILTRQERMDRPVN